MKHYIDTMVITSFLRAGRIEKRGIATQLILRVGLTELGFRSLLGRGPQPVLVLQRRSPGELGPDLEGCAPWQVLDLTGDALKLL